MKHFKYIFLSICLLVSTARLYANHIFGGELLYTHITGNTYRVALTFYGDCASSVITNLYTNTPLVHVYNNQSFYQDLLLQPEVIGVEVSPVCPGQLNQTTCNGGTLPGVRKFVYSDTVVLSGPSAHWRFIMTGDLPPNSFAGRSANLTNINPINGPGTSVIYLETTLNNLNGPNSSPEYSTLPTPFYCINVPESYNQGAIDPDNDSLVFALTPALDSVTSSASTPENYAPGYSATNPIHVAPGTFNFNVLNGQMNFTPDLQGDFLVVCQVSEYRNGVLVGTSSRELSFIILNTCSATPPVANMVKSTVNGGELDSNNVLYVCEGTPSIGFNVRGGSPTGDSITVSFNNTLPNSTTAVLYNNTDTPLINFTWNTDSVKAGVYNFYVTLKNNHCPISSTQTFAYTIYIVKQNTISAKQVTATGCVHKAQVDFNFNYGLLPRTVIIKEGSVILDSIKDTTGAFIDSFKAGKYYVEVTSPYLNCPSYYTVTVVDSGALPSPYQYGFADCLFDKPDSIQFLPFAGASVVWHNMDGTTLSGAPTPDNTKVGKQQWYVIQDLNVCVSYADTVTVTVNNLPDVQITTSAAPVCLGDKVYFAATGGEDYKWSSTANKLFTDTGGIYTNVLLPDTYTVSAHDSNGCVNSDSLKLDSIERCCVFSYPNVFTPNQDNINDKYHVVQYGNTDAYELSIYNRWGERVFHTFDPHEGWDGTYKQKPCEMDSYYFYFRAHCLTGHSEAHKGVILLYR